MYILLWHHEHEHLVAGKWSFVQHTDAVSVSVFQAREESANLTLGWIVRRLADTLH